MLTPAENRIQRCTQLFDLRLVLGRRVRIALKMRGLQQRVDLPSKTRHVPSSRLATKSLFSFQPCWLASARQRER